MTNAAPDLPNLPEPIDEATTLAELRALGHVRALSDLFGRRPDLTGVYSPADLASEAVRWSA